MPGKTLYDNHIGFFQVQHVQKFIALAQKTLSKGELRWLGTNMAELMVAEANSNEKKRLSFGEMITTYGLNEGLDLLAKAGLLDFNTDYQRKKEREIPTWGSIRTTIEAVQMEQATAQVKKEPAKTRVVRL